MGEQYEFRAQIIHLDILWYTFNGIHSTLNSNSKKIGIYDVSFLLAISLLIYCMHSHSPNKEKLQENLCNSFLGRTTKYGANQIRWNQNEFFVCSCLQLACIWYCMYTTQAAPTLNVMVLFYLFIRFFFSRSATTSCVLCVCVCVSMSVQCMLLLIIDKVSVCIVYKYRKPTEMGAC